MENVIAFNSELSGLYDSKPPISKAKMASITKAAMRAIKFYKHVVQSVEKFILKCKPEYKIPGLYVIDSIVRQSRHQFGPEKDVFAPRFARNLRDTFANLFRCPPEEKSRIIRVLNLWQKNSVFAPEVIQPIFDLADPNHPIYQLPPAGLPAATGAINDMPSSTSNGINTSNTTMEMNLANTTLSNSVDEKMSLPDLSNNNLQQLLNDPNVIRQLQTLQNFQKFKQDDKQHKMNEMRMQEEAFEKHLQNVLKGTGSNETDGANDFNKEVEFVSEEQKIEVINLDGNSRSPTPDRDRYRRRRSRSRSRSRSRDRGGGRDRSRRRRSLSRSRSRSPRSNRRRVSRDRDRNNRDKEKEREHDRERRKKGLPEIKKEHLSVCSTTLWVGHLSKLVYQEELSDTFGEYGDIVSIDQIVPRGCAFIVMNRRQDAYKAMQNLKNHKLQGRAITISWAAGKGVKSKEWKDYWDLELGVTYIPWNKLDENTDFDSLEEGGMFDEDSMPSWMKDKINQIKGIKDRTGSEAAVMPQSNLLFNIDTTQPPPGPPPTMMSMVPGQYSLAPPMGGPPRMLGPMGMPMSGIPMPPNLVPGMPPPHAMMMATGIMPPGYPPMPTQVGGATVPGQLGLAAGAAQFAPPPNAATVTGANLSSDDQMDIEMEVEEPGPVPGNAVVAPAQSQSQLIFNQPPPLFTPVTNPTVANMNEVGDIFSTRERTRSTGAASRWGACSTGAEEEAADATQRWREANAAAAAGPLAANFNDNRGVVRNGGGPLNIPPLDLNNPPQRPDFMNDFDNRGGGHRGNGPRAGNQNNGDFFMNNNVTNRFNQPTSLLQMRIPPPSSFNPRMGGPGAPMFMRGQGGMGNRQQGPGFFNTRNAFERDNVRGSGRGGGGGGGGGRSGNRSRNSGPGGQGWSDEEDEGGSNNFKRRGPGGNRFRDRDGSADRMSRERGTRRSGGGERGGPRDRHDRELRDAEREQRGSRSAASNRRNSRDDTKVAASATAAEKGADSEEDWDNEPADSLHNNKSKVDQNKAAENNFMTPVQPSDDSENTNAQLDAPSTSVAQHAAMAFAEASNEEKSKENVIAAPSTPLYDELPGSAAVTSTTSPKVASPCPAMDMIAVSAPSANDELEKAVETTTTSIDEGSKIVESN